MLIFCFVESGLSIISIVYMLVSFFLLFPQTEIMKLLYTPRKSYIQYKIIQSDRKKKK